MSQKTNLEYKGLMQHVHFDRNILDSIQKVRLLRRGAEGVLESEQKQTEVGGILACVHVCFFF